MRRLAKCMSYRPGHIDGFYVNDVTVDSQTQHQGKQRRTKTAQDRRPGPWCHQMIARGNAR
jgi:hypothetical protein